jgi:DNA-binding transcriptional MerR regulator
MSQGLTIQEAAETTGWTARMLRYLESSGLIEPRRTAAGYRLYGPEELQRLATLRELLDRHGLGPSDVAFAKRLRDEPDLQADIGGWLQAKATRPDTVDSSDWLRFEQEKHQRLLSVA